MSKSTPWHNLDSMSKDFASPGSTQFPISTFCFLITDIQKKKETFFSLSTSLPNSFTSSNKTGNIKKTCNTCNTCKTRYPAAIIQGSFLFLFVLNKKTKEHAMDIEIYQYINQGTASNIAIFWCKAATSLKKRSSKTFSYAVDKKTVCNEFIEILVGSVASPSHWLQLCHWVVPQSKQTRQKNMQKKEHEAKKPLEPLEEIQDDDPVPFLTNLAVKLETTWKKCKQQSWHEIRRVTGGGAGRRVKSCGGPAAGGWT